MISPRVPIARIGAFFTALLALWQFWPPLVSWWPPLHLFWPLILLGGALLLLVPERLPSRLRAVGAHRNFGVVFAAIVAANFWVHGGLLWLFAAVPLALAFWRGPQWSWNPMELPLQRRLFLVAAWAALICLRLTWTTADMSTGSYFVGGLDYGLNTYNPGTGYYEWGWQYNALHGLMPGVMMHFDFAATQLRGGTSATLICLALALCAARRDFALGRREISVGLALLGAWWTWNLLRGNVTQFAAWAFVATLGAMAYTSLKKRDAVPLG